MQNNFPSVIPNLLTIIRILLTPVFVYFFIQEQQSAQYIATSVFFVASFTDWLDGKIARKMHQTTRLGQFLDPIADKILVSSALVMFAFKNYLYLWMMIVIILRDFLITALRMYALYRGKVIITSSFAKWKTFFQMGFVFAMLLYLLIPNAPDITLTYSGSDWLLWSTLAAMIVVILTTASGIHYIFYNRIHIKEIYKRLTHRWF